MATAEKDPNDKAYKDADLTRDYQEIFRSEAGQRVLYDLMKKGYFVAPTHAPNDIHATNLNEGRRELVLYIIERLNRSAEELYKFIAQQEREGTDYAQDDIY